MRLKPFAGDVRLLIDEASQKNYLKTNKQTTKSSRKSYYKNVAQYYTGDKFKVAQAWLILVPQPSFPQKACLQPKSTRFP